MTDNTITPVSVPLVARTTRGGGHVILCPPNNYEYDGPALLKAKTLLAFCSMKNRLDYIDLEYNDCVVAAVNTKSRLNGRPIELFFHLAGSLCETPNVIGLLPTFPFVTRINQPGYAIIKRDYVDTFDGSFLDTARRWLEQNPEIDSQMTAMLNIEQSVA